MTIISRMASRVVFFALTGSILSCDMRTELKEMHDSTQKMEKSTEKMVEITDRMAKTTETMGSDVSEMKKETKDVRTSVQDMGGKMESVNDNFGNLNGKFDNLQGHVESLNGKIGKLGEGIDETYDGLRQGDSSNLRRIAFEGMLKAKAHEKKLLEAAQYVAGFEFYFWRDMGIDTNKNRREDLVFQATEQFFKDVYELYNYSPKVFAMADPDMGEAFNKEASFNAMAAALHRDNPKQKENIKLMSEKGITIEELSFLKIIQQGLIAKINVDDGKLKRDQVPAHLKEVMNNPEISIKLLQARWNFLAVAALDKSFHFKQNGAFKYFRSAWNLAKKWELDFSKLGVSQIADQLFYLEQAKETRDFLNSIGVKTKPDPLLAAFISRMKPVNLVKTSPEGTGKISKVLTLIDSFKD